MSEEQRVRCTQKQKYKCRVGRACRLSVGALKDLVGENGDTGLGV